MGDISLLPYLFIWSIIYLGQCGFTDNCPILWITIQQYFILWFSLFQFWILGNLLSCTLCALDTPYHNVCVCGYVCACTLVCMFTSYSRPRISHVSKKSWDPNIVILLNGIRNPHTHTNIFICNICLYIKLNRSRAVFSPIHYHIDHSIFFPLLICKSLPPAMENLAPTVLHPFNQLCNSNIQKYQNCWLVFPLEKTLSTRV